jgi:hypothetical protein
MLKQILPLIPLTSLLLLTNIKATEAVTFRLSGFSLSDGTNTYRARGTFDWDGGAFSSLSNTDQQIQDTFSLQVTGSNGYSQILNSSNIDFNSSTILGDVNDDNTEVTFSLIDIVDNSFNVLLSDDSFDQSYDDFDNFISLSTFNGDSGTPFNPATAIPEPITILGTLTSLAFCAGLKGKK